ncbi:hypothetical protein [Actinomadura barringtoniae]|nr:hypothetical protein [Actinomadura barringtoniae]
MTPVIGPAVWPPVFGCGEHRPCAEPSAATALPHTLTGTEIIEPV